jgi:hypothetical protein
LTEEEIKRDAKHFPSVHPSMDAFVVRGRNAKRKTEHPENESEVIVEDSEPLMDTPRDKRIPSEPSSVAVPLADRIRPTSLDEIFGQDPVLGKVIQLSFLWSSRP